MVKAYIITYDLKYEKDDELLAEELKKFRKWWHYIDRTWIVITDKTVDEIWNIICGTLSKENNILIVELNKHFQGWLPRSAWNWIDENITKDR